MLGFEKDDKPPPSYDSTIPQTLTTSSHGVTLTISTPSSGNFLPGDLIQGNVKIPGDVLGSMEGALKCSLEGKSSVEVMGKPRYQVCPRPPVVSLFDYRVNTGSVADV